MCWTKQLNFFVAFIFIRLHGLTGAPAIAKVVNLGIPADRGGNHPGCTKIIHSVLSRFFFFSSFSESFCVISSMPISHVDYATYILGEGKEVGATVPTHPHVSTQLLYHTFTEQHHAF